MSNSRLRPRALVAALIAVLLLGSGVSAARPAHAAVPEILALTEGGEGDQLPGPEPNPTSTFAPEPYEAPWTWWLGVILAAVAVISIGGVGLGYWLLVRRPRERE